jgi:hypothetical protein
MAAATIAELHLINTYKKYKCSLKVVDDARIRASDLLKAAVKQMMHQPNVNHQPSTHCASCYVLFFRYRFYC